MVEIRSVATLQGWSRGVWEVTGGRVIAEVEGATLEGADLRGRTLDWADLRQANLRGADLGRASLSGADLSGADLTDACLRKTMLMGASLRGAALDRADLGEAALTGAHLEGADLRLARLEGARLGGCYFDEMTRWPEGFDPWEHGAGPSETMEWHAREWMASGMTPEEYAGQFGDQVLVFGACFYQYRDPEVTRWMRRLGNTLAEHDPGSGAGE